MQEKQNNIAASIPQLVSRSTTPQLQTGQGRIYDPHSF